MRLIRAMRPALPPGYNLFFRCALFLLIGASLLRKLFDPDVWFHLIVGREVVRRMSLPGQEFYILPRLGEPGEFHEWGFGVFYYLIEHYSGYAGMAVVNAAFGCGILLCLLLAAAGSGKAGWWQLLPPLALAMYAIEPRLNFRPETLLYLLLAAEIYLLENYLARRKPAWLLPLPVFCWLLIQCHPSAIFLIGVFGMYAVQAVLNSAEKFKIAAMLGAVALAMAGASALNPYGLHQLLMPFYALANDDLVNSVNEFLPVLDTVYAPQFIAVALAGAVAILFSPQRRPVDILLFLAFAVLAFRYARNIALLGIVSYVAITNTFGSWVGRLANTRARKIIAATLSVAIGLAAIVKASGSSAWGIGLDEEYTPYRSAQLLKRLEVRGNILNFFHLGSYLAWELERPVFVDGKNYGTNKAVMLHDDAFMARQNLGSIIGSYNIRAIVTPVTLAFSGEIIPLVANLAEDDDWALVGRERAGLLFIRNRELDGFPALPKSVIWQKAIEELNDTIRSYPGNKEAHRSLSTVYGHIGDAAKQWEYYERYLALQK